MFISISHLFFIIFIYIFLENTSQKTKVISYDIPVITQFGILCIWTFAVEKLSQCEIKRSKGHTNDCPKDIL